MPSVRYAGPPRVAIYTRVSTTDQEREGTSLETQQAAALRYCAEHGYTVAGTFVETHTGSELYERRELSRLRELVRAKQVDVLLSYALDRLARDQKHIYLIDEECERHGCRLEFVTEEFEDTAVGKFIRSAKAFAAEVEREKIIERTMRGSRARVESGKMIPGYKPLYGYQWTEDHTGLVVDPSTAPIVRRIYAEAISGKTLRQIALGLTADGVPTPSGRTPHWTHPTVRWILSHPTYTGRLRAGRQKIVRVAGRKSLVSRPVEEQLPLPPCPSLVSEETFDLVAHQLRRNQEQSYRNNHDPEGALLRGGYVRCGYCDCAMTVRAYLTAQRTSVYRCNAQRGASGAHCEDAPHITVPELDRRVWARLSAFLGQPEVLPTAFMEAYQQPRGPAPSVRSAEQQLRALDAQQQRLIDSLALVEGDSVVLITRRLQDLDARKRLLREEAAQQLDELERWQEVEQRVLQLQDWCTLTAQHLERLDFAERRAVLDWLDVRVYVWKAEDQPPEVTAQLPDPKRRSAEVRWRIVERKGTHPHHNDGIRLRWVLE